MKRYIVIVFSIIVAFSLKGQNPNTVSLISNQGIQVQVQHLMLLLIL